MSKFSSKGPSQRQLRVGELVRHSLTQLLQRREVQDDALENTIVSVSEVSMSPDLKIATAYIAPLGGGDTQKIIKALAANAKFIRGRLAPQLNQMKYMPDFRFREDTSFDNYSRIDALLQSDKVRQDLDKE
ncbi:MAG: 30S ribosome-binding factor RbfA [Pseudomonadota bacterium]